MRVYGNTILLVSLYFFKYVKLFFYSSLFLILWMVNLISLQQASASKTGCEYHVEMLLCVLYARPLGNLMMIKHNGRILFSLWTYMYKCIYIRCSVQRTHCYSKDVEGRDVIGPILVLNLTSYLICINILWWSCYIVWLLLDISDRIEHGLYYFT